MRISRKFSDYASAYSSFDQIPDSDKLHNYEQQFKQEDVWKVYLSEQYDLESISNETFRDLKRTGTRWKNVCDGKCHHACASPKIINGWSAQLINKMKNKSANKNYLRRLNKFYRFLMWHADYPHSYNPVQFAVENHQETREIWSETYGWLEDD